MPASCPAMLRKDLFTKGIGFVFQRRCEGFIPPIEEAKQGNDANDLDNLLFAPTFTQPLEHFIGRRIRYRGSSYS